MKGCGLRLGVNRVPGVDIRSPKRWTEALPLLPDVRPHRQCVHESIAIAEHDLHARSAIEESERKQKEQQGEAVFNEKATAQYPSLVGVPLLIRHGPLFYATPRSSF